MMDSEVMTSLQSQFASDLFLMVHDVEPEVPMVNKPRRACSYFNSTREIKIFSALLFILPTAINWEMNDKELCVAEATRTAVRP